MSDDTMADDDFDLEFCAHGYIVGERACAKCALEKLDQAVALLREWLKCQPTTESGYPAAPRLADQTAHLLEAIGRS